jgi:hypothetical protein
VAPESRCIRNVTPACLTRKFWQGIGEIELRDTL